MEKSILWKTRRGILVRIAYEMALGVDEESARSWLIASSSAGRISWRVGIALWVAFALTKGETQECPNYGLYSAL